MNYALTLDQISRIHQAAQSAAARAVDHLLTMRNWLIGAYIVEYEQNGEDRAVYGEKLLKTVADDLAWRGMRKLSETNLKYCRTFALAYTAPAIRQTLSDEFGTLLPSGFAAGAVETLKTLPFPSLAARHALQPPLSWQEGEYYAQLFHYLKEEVSHPDENPPVGLILCTDKDAAEVHYATAGMDQQLFVSRYLVALPSEEQLKRWLLEEREQLQRAKT